MQTLNDLPLQELRLVQGGSVLVDVWNRIVKCIVDRIEWPASCGDDEECLYFGPPECA